MFGNSSQKTLYSMKNSNQYVLYGSVPPRKFSSQTLRAPSSSVFSKSSADKSAAGDGAGEQRELAFLKCCSNLAEYFPGVSEWECERESLHEVGVELSDIYNATYRPPPALP